ncbi:unnamed protein product [Caenorhabditis bovis]|uniref:Uncharacterized protein n=1 Tax=Caenorhabditis bovis TaxID=2654633 RepID=A0A8S1ERI1_9PELO|nr:unnamed protein product [Caenorhabditis bovis]
MFNNIFNTVKDAAGTVAKTIEEQNRQNAQAGSQQQHADVEEAVGKVDSQGGKVQVTTVHDEAKKEEPNKGSDFLADFLNVAQEVGKAYGKTLEEQKKQQQQAGVVEESVAKVDSQGGKVQIATVQDEKKVEQKPGTDLLAGFINVAQEVGKAYSKSVEEQNKQKNQEEPIGKVDSQGGKVQVSSVQENKDTAQPAAGSSLLNNFLNIAQDVGKALEKKTEDGHQNTNPTPVAQKPAESKELNDSDLKVIGENIGSIVSGLFKKDEEKKSEFKPEPVIDDIEGEIGKVTTTGYTGLKKKEN